MGQKLGQHFLKDKKTLELISSLAVNENVPFFIEIGPGHGELTSFLLKEKVAQVIAIEKDKKLFDFLKIRFGSNKKLKIINGDALTLLEEVIKKEKLKNNNYVILGNIPYYISGHILRTISELKKKPKSVIFLLQKEVAQRIAAEPPHMNLLSSITKIWAEPQIIKFVPKKSFSPPPNVDSCLIKLNTKKSYVKNFEEYCIFVKKLFKQPRKTIKNNLRGFVSQEKIKEVFLKLKIKENERPQNLNIDTIYKMFKIIINENKLY
jgi:16S rRNA (adenine1518-N6/adenine1519-N6)-dimethyltransferase